MLLSLAVYLRNECVVVVVVVEYLHIFWLSIRWNNFNLQLLPPSLAASIC